MGEARKLLVANRGEIAVRIFSHLPAARDRDGRRRGPGRRGALHTRVADAVVPVALLPRRRRARPCRARARAPTLVHPGYGFLAESAAFAEAVLDAGLTWIGPPPEALRRGGDKLEAKRIAARRRACRRSTTGEPEELGFPLLVKAAAGGGGRGMRVVERRRSSPRRSAAASREAEAAFGDGTSSASAISSAPATSRCSSSATATGTSSRSASATARSSAATRRSSRSPRLPALARVRGAPRATHAVAFGRAVGYESAGTAEFLVDGDERFFLELNGRIQVEHPVTEAVTGLDLVELQLRVADGELARRAAPASAGTRSRRDSTPRTRARSSRSPAPRAAPPAGDDPRRRRCRRGRRGRRRLRPDDREADRARRRPRRCARPASPRRSTRRSSRASTTNLPFLRWLVAHPGFRTPVPVDRLPHEATLRSRHRRAACPPVPSRPPGGSTSPRLRPTPGPIRRRGPGACRRGRRRRRVLTDARHRGRASRSRPATPSARASRSSSWRR